MSLGLVGKKVGMTRVFDEQGRSQAVTVIMVLPNVVTQVKEQEKDGYNAYQVSFGNKKPSRVNKPLRGHYAAAKVEPGEGLWEFRVSEDLIGKYQLGDAITAELLQEGQAVDVAGTSKGKGFAGVIKRHNFRTQDASHGNSLSHRAPGSIGQNQSPGRVFKGKKMAGQLGNKACSVINQVLVKIDKEKHIVLVSGSVPGAPGGYVTITPSVRESSNEQAKR